jgi:hypothetical protein
MKSRLFVLIAALMFIYSGCMIQLGYPPEPSDYPDSSDYPPVYDDSDYPPPPPIPDAEYPSDTRDFNFDARINAARSMTSISSRDAAFTSIALDAANVLDIRHTITAVSMIMSISAKDNAAEKCVTPFINKNMMEEASRIANQITSISTKDRVLARIARGPERNY